MPLKHLTETVLVVLLALVTIATGIIVSTLPHIPAGFFPWVATFISAVIYPALVYPILKNNRADNSFRALHFAPVTITLMWMFIEIALLKEPRLQLVASAYTWVFSTPAVAATFILISVFCLQVIRRREARLGFLVVLFTPFLAGAVASESSMHWDARLASLLWKTPVEIAMVPSGTTSSAPSSKGEKNLASSSVAEEEQWREKLRTVEEGTVHSVSSAMASVKGPKQGLTAAVGLAGKALGSEGTSHSTPRTHLPKAGGEMEAIGIFVLAAFAATLHKRARMAV